MNTCVCVCVCVYACTLILLMTNYPKIQGCSLTSIRETALKSNGLSSELIPLARRISA